MDRDRQREFQSELLTSLVFLPRSSVIALRDRDFRRRDQGITLGHQCSDSNFSSFSRWVSWPCMWFISRSSWSLFSWLTLFPTLFNPLCLRSGCSDLFTTSRTLYSIAQKGQAPRIFARTNRFGVPVYAVGISWCIGLLAFLGSSSGSGNVFNFLVNLTALSGILTWFAIA